MPAAPSLAFGVDPTRCERYSLRQARYHALGEDIGRMIADASRQGRTLRLLDVGIFNGVLMRYIEEHNDLGTAEIHGVDLKLRSDVYRASTWSSLVEDNLMDGLPKVPSNHFDIVVCEQVLEHLPAVEAALAALSRVTKPGGAMLLGVPIFTPLTQPIRQYVVPLWDRLVRTKKIRGHLQAFTRGSFLRAIEQHCDATVNQTRGFRIISGGMLRPLEDYRWWWQLNRTIGRWAPALCTEIQVVAVKNGQPMEDTPQMEFIATAQRMTDRVVAAR